MALLKVNRAADSSIFVEESFWYHKSEVDRRFAERWRQVMPEDKPAPNMEHFLEFMALDLAASRETMVVTAQVHVTKSGGDGEVRVQRNEGQDLGPRQNPTLNIQDSGSHETVDRPRGPGRPRL